MSDFLNNLVARQLGTVAPVRPRLAGRFEPPPDAFAPESPFRAATSDEADAGPRELVFEVEARPAPAREDSTARVGPEAERAQTTRRESNDTSTRVVIFKESRAREHSHDAHDTTPPPTRGAESRPPTRGHEEGGAPVRPARIVPPSDEEERPDAAERAHARRAHAEPSAGEAGHAERGERRTPHAPEPRESRRFDGGDAPPHPADLRPTPTSAAQHRDAADAPRASDGASTPKRIEPARTLETSRAREAENEEARAERHERRARRDVPTLVPQPPRSRRDARHDAASRNDAPTVNVTIGRVEVRATQAAPSAPRPANANAPRMSLDEYLRRRTGEVRE
jgi:hypothetical protein